MPPSSEILGYARHRGSVVGRWVGAGMLTMGTGALLAELFVLRWEASPGFEVPLAVTAFFWSGTLAGFGALAVACLPETRLYQRLLLFFVGTLLLVMGLLQAFDVMWELKVALWGW